MATNYPIRPVSEAELTDFVLVGQEAFNSTWPTDKLIEHYRKLLDLERSYAAFDGDEMVGTAMSYAFELTIPGGVIDAAGISGVSVLPTHRRRGILSSLMRQQLADLSSSGEPVAVLFASESAIYQRYGFGMTGDEYNFDILASQRPLTPAPDGEADGLSASLQVRLASPQSALKDLMAVYDTVRLGHPGMVARSEQWWDVSLADPEFMRGGRTPQRCVVAADSTGVRGYALYSAKSQWSPDGIPDHTIYVHELFAVDPAASAALWTNLLTRDLVTEVRARMRPTDDPLLHVLANRRAARAQACDGLWLRLVDLPTALAGRQYACAVDVVIDVTDDLLPVNSGRWRLRASGVAGHASPTCERVQADPDLRLGAADIGAAYLGGTRLGSLAAAGRVTELRSGSLAALSAAMSWDPLPWSPMMF